MLHFPQLFFSLWSSKTKNQTCTRTVAKKKKDFLFCFKELNDKFG